MIFKAKFPGHCRTCDKPVAVGDTLSYTEGNDYTEHYLCSEEGRKREEQKGFTFALSFAALSDFYPPSPPGQSYLPFQRAGIHFAVTRPLGMGALIADEMGLGKTIQALGVINALQSELSKVLIICPASVKLNWRNEAHDWLFNTADIQIGSDPIFDPEARTHVQITNYDRLGELRGDIAPDLVVYDEAHYIKGRDTERSLKSMFIAKRAKRKLALSGTPIPNQVQDLFTLLRILDPTEWHSWIPFAKQYCAAHDAFRYHGKRLVKYTDTSGASNIEELQQKLRSTIMVRRLKKDVLPELPEKIYSIFTLPSDGVKAALEKELDKFHSYGFTEEMDVDEMKYHRVPFEEISKARKEVGLAKVPFVIEHVKELLEADREKKIILFAHHSEVITKLFDGLFKFGTVVLRGETPDEMRQAAVERFQQNPHCRLFVGSIGAAGAGITLHASSHVVFAEVSWSPKDMAQAWDRAHRIGQKNAVLIELLVFDGSLDGNIMKKLVKKIQIANRALDGEVL